MCNQLKKSERMTFAIPDDDVAERLMTLKQRPEFAGRTWSAMLGDLVSIGIDSYEKQAAKNPTN